MKFLKRNRNGKPNESLLLNLTSNSRYAESFRTLRTNLNFAAMEKGLNSILVTSSVESEGKTNTVINLGYIMAQAGQKVLLVDADLRRPRLTGLFELKRSKGLADIVSNDFSQRVTKGKLTKYTIGDLLQLFKLQKRTGELSIESQEKVAIYFVSGEVVDIYWKTRPETEKLANTLIRNKLLTKEEAKLALGHQKKSVQRLGSILYSMGLISKEKLAKELAVHTVEAMRVVSTLQNGDFTFTPLSKNEIHSPISKDVNFEKLFSELLGENDDIFFLNNTIKRSIQPLAVDNLFILPSGKVPPNPSEVVGSSGVDLLIELLNKEFDLIIIDSPPVMPATDALILAPRTDGTILVVKSGKTERKIVKNVVENFRQANLPILGILLNQVNLNKEGYYQYYRKYYSSYYGEK